MNLKMTMKNFLPNIGIVSLVALLAFGCNSDLEKRLSDLERRVAELENSNLSKSSTINSNASTPVVQTSKQTTEVKPDGPLPKFTFEKEIHDFGEIEEGEVVNHVFTFKNSGEAPLVIESAKASCGCTVPRWPKKPIPAGGSGEIEVSFNSKGKPGVQNKTVTITANTYPKIKRLNIKSTVKPKAG